MTGDCVVDASVGIKLFLDEPGSTAVDALFAQLTAATPPRFYVPDLFYSECANILWKYVRHFGYPAASARQDIADLLALRLQTISAADLLPDALDLALQYGITAGDGCYAALARQLNLPFCTADAPLTRKLTASGLTIHTLSDYPTTRLPD